MLVSLANVKIFLEITSTDHDALLGLLIEHVSDRIQTFLNRNLEKEYRTKYYNTGRRKYYLSAYPIDSSAVITITVDTSTQTKDDDFFVWEDEGLIEFDYKTTYTEPKQIVITWLGGYSSSTISVADVSKTLLAVPDAVSYACLLQVAFMFRTKKSIGLSSVTTPDGSIQALNPTELLPEVKSILMEHRKMAAEY
jgi:hypothetical protein